MQENPQLEVLDLLDTFVADFQELVSGDESEGIPSLTQAVQQATGELKRIADALDGLLAATLRGFGES